MKRFIARMKCKLLGHNLTVVDVSSTGNSEKVGCSRCVGYFGMNHAVRAFIQWDKELEQCFTLTNNRHSKYWPKNRQWLEGATNDN